MNEVVQGMNSNRIDIAKYVSQLEQGQFNINKLADVAICLSIEILLLPAMLDSSNKTLMIDNELRIWTISVLAASWTGYIFVVKGSSPSYI